MAKVHGLTFSDSSDPPGGFARAGSLISPRSRSIGSGTCSVGFDVSKAGTGSPGRPPKLGFGMTLESSFRNSVRLETWKFHGFSSNLI